MHERRIFRRIHVLQCGSTATLALVAFAHSAIAQPALLPPIEPGDITVRLELVAANLDGPVDPDDPASTQQFFPVVLAHAGDGSGRLFVGTIGGVIRVIESGVLLAEPFLDTTDENTVVHIGQYGLTGLAFHPAFADPAPGNPGFGRLYTISAEKPGAGVPDFTVPQTGDNHRSVIYEWCVDPRNPNVADFATRREIMRVQQPRMQHNVNELAFGPDGYLYIAVGDGGNTTASSLHAQQLSNIFGSVLRIDVDHLPGNITSANGQYAIPADNPFVNHPDHPDAAAEIYAYGLRNPWRLTFDRETGDLYVGDVGQRSIEEINLIVKGGNYGWNHKEGSFIYDNVNFTTFNAVNSVAPDLPDANGQTLADKLGLIDPLPGGEYDHIGGGRCVIGGYVYRGNGGPKIDALAGMYVFGELTFSRLLYYDANEALVRELQIDASGSGGVAFPPGTPVYSMGEDEAGELYAMANLTSLGYGQALLRFAPLAKIGDLNGDGTVGVADLLMLLANWGPCDDCDPGTPGDCPPDLTGDCTVGVGDLLVLLANWG